MCLKYGFTVHGEWLVNRERIPRYQIRAPTDEDETLEESPGVQKTEKRRPSASAR